MMPRHHMKLLTPGAGPADPGAARGAPGAVSPAAANRRHLHERQTQTGGLAAPRLAIAANRPADASMGHRFLNQTPPARTARGSDQRG